MNFDCIVIGGGPAGMMAAIAAANNNKTALLEHGGMVGRKILSTGNGRCNLTNEKMDAGCYYCSDPSFVRQVLEDFDVQALRDFFHRSGVLTKSRDGYVYPLSDQAAVVREALESRLHHAGVAVLCDVQISAAEKKEKFHLGTSKGTFTCSSLIVAAGSKAAPKTGSDGSGYELCRRLGVTVNKSLPALTALKSSEPFCPRLAGVRAEARVSLHVDGSPDAEDRGEVQFTEYGLSGIPVFQVSRQAVRALDSGRTVQARLDLISRQEPKDVIRFLMHGKSSFPNTELWQWCGGLLNKKLARVLLTEAGLFKEGLSLRELTQAQAEKLAFLMGNFPFRITGYQGFEYGQACSGGVDVGQIDARTMGCKTIPGLYFAGEIIDVDGICGGYNLQWAFSSGHVAGTHAGGV